MTVKKYTRSLIEYVLKRYKIKTCKSVGGASALLTAILRLDYQFFFPNRGTAKTRLPSTEILNK